MSSVFVRHKKNQPFICPYIAFKILRPLLLKESSVQLKVNDSACNAAAYVDQMMRLLIGL